jgi:hypothetical protein
VVQGAQAMISDGLLMRFQRRDFTFAIQGEPIQERRARANSQLEGGLGLLLVAGQADSPNSAHTLSDQALA